MRDDYVRILQKVNQLEIEIRTKGPAPLRVLRLATLQLAIGQPVRAIEHATAITGDTNIDPAIIREAVWICSLALALKISILEGTTVGAPGLKLTATMGIGMRKEAIEESRKAAIELLEGLPELDAEETGLLRKLKLGVSLESVEEMISAKLD